ncbi:MAG TPA: glycosyltransferase family 9 protein, partial [Candidatus Dormibacteraeota bacterium]|nr:glycosyltransferase family 9 protein [Candidatus Dormibacteraeota bacterium]
MKLLIRATNWVGDAVMCIPALEAVRAHWPQAEISILARPWVADLYRGQPFANRIIPLDASVRSPFAMENIARELGREHFDCALLLQNAFSAAWLAWRAGIPERIGYASDARRLLLTRVVRVPRNGEIPAHESYYYLELLRRIGWLEKLPTITQIVLHLAPGASETAELCLQKTGVHPGSLRIALAPGAAYGAAKCWLPERFAAVADSLVDEFNADVILFGTTSEVEVLRQIAARMRHQPISLVGQTPIGELPALFSRCQLFIGNDSGAMHV